MAYFSPDPSVPLMPFRFGSGTASDWWLKRAATRNFALAVAEALPQAIPTPAEKRAQNNAKDSIRSYGYLYNRTVCT
jgi:hypothetical protein